MALHGADILSCERLVAIGRKCHDLLSNRPELQTLLHADGSGRSLLVELCVHGLLLSQVPRGQLLRPKAAGNLPHQHMLQRQWVLIGQKEVRRVLQLNEDDLNIRVLDQLSSIRDAYLNGSDMRPSIERLVFMQPLGSVKPYYHAVVPEQVWQHMHGLHAVAQAARARGPPVACYYLHPLVCGHLDGVAGADMQPWARAAFNGVTRLGILCVADIAQWRRESMSATLGRGRGVPTAGRAAPAPTELRDWLRAGMRQEVLGGALQNIGTLVQDSTLEVSHDIDFGQCSLSKHQLPPDEHLSMQARAAQVPKLQRGSSCVPSLQAWLRDAAFVSHRSVTLTNKAAAPVLLVDLGIHPNTRGLFFILDSHALWRHRPTDDQAQADLECLELAPGASHSVTVLTKTPQVAGLPEIEVLQHEGIFQSVLTAIVWQRAPTRGGGASCRFPMRAPPGSDAQAAQLAWFPQERFSVDVVGCRVCATFTRSSQSARAALHAARNAAPFVPRELRLAFTLLGWRAPAPPCPPELLRPYMPLRVQELHVMSLLGAPVHKSARGMCVVSPMIPVEMCVLDQNVLESCGAPLGWEPDMCLSGGVAAILSDTAAVLQLSATVHGLLVRGSTGVERQQPNMDFVQRPLQQTREVVEHLGLGVAAGADRAVEHMHRMLTAEGLAMLQDSFTMDAVVDMHVAEFSDLDARRMLLLGCLPGSGSDAPVLRSRYRGPELKTLANQTGMLAHDPGSGRWYLLAVKVPNMLENRPHLVFGSRVHVTYKNSPAEDVCAVLDQFQSWCIVSAPAWLVEAARLGFQASRIPNHAGPSPSLQQAVLRFAIDRTPLQRMMAATAVHSNLSHASAARPAVIPAGLIPPRPSDESTADAYAEFHTVGRLPADLFADGSDPQQGPLWHHQCVSGPITHAERSAVDDFCSSFKVMGPVQLNREQMQAVSAMCTVAAGSKPLALFGPPGTGKTVTLVEMVLHLLGNNGNTILVSAPQNFTCDTFCQRLLAAGVPQSSILRVIDPRWPASRVNDQVMGCTLVDRDWAAFKLPTHAQLRAARVVIITCTATALLMRYRGSLFRPPVPFTHVLVDEAGQLPFPEALLPLLMLPRDPSGRIHGAACLAGDPRQLGAQMRSPVAAAGGLSESLLERLIAYYRGLPTSDPARDILCTVLVCNYRSHAHLLRLPSRMFYGSALVACAPEAETRLPTWSLLPKGDGVESNTVLVPVHGEQRRLDNSPALYNMQEAQVVAEHVTSLLQDQVRAPAGAGPVTAAQVGVICMSRAQAICVRNLLRKDGLHDVNVGTVDDFQGQEMRVIFVTAVLTKPEAPASGAGEAAAAVGFFNNPKRFNVTITRAKALLVVVGHPDMLKRDRQWGHLWRFCKSRQAIVGDAGEADELLGDIANLTLGAQAQHEGAQQVVPLEAFAVEQQMRVAL